MEKLKQVQVTSNVPPHTPGSLVLADVLPPPPEVEIGLNMNAIEQNHFKRGHQVYFTIYPPFPVPLSDSMPEQETGEFQFQMDMDIWTQTPSTTPHQPPKNEMLIFGLRSDVPPPPRNGKVEISGQCDILLLADVLPPPRVEINMNAIGNN